MYAIRRMKRAVNACCWAVDCVRRGKHYAKRFHGQKHGATQKALDAAIAWRDRTLVPAGVFTRREFCQQKRSSNTSGVPGARRVLAWTLITGLSALHAGLVFSQEYPARPVRIVTADVGSLNDLSARLIAQGLTANLGQQFIVENRGGASGTIAAQTVAKAPPDGYTLLLYSGALWLGPLIQDLPWNALRDFSPIAAVVKSPNVLAVHPSLPVKSVKELIALAKARPGELNYGSSSIGSGNHLAAELFKSLAKVNIVRVGYKGGGGMMNAAISGEVQVVFGAAGLVKPHAASGRLRALAVCNTEPSALMPGLPTVAESGLPGYKSESLFAVFAPAMTPAAIVSRLNQEILRVLNSAQMKERFVNGGVEIVASSPEQLTATIKSDIVSIGKLVKDAGIRVQ